MRFKASRLFCLFALAFGGACSSMPLAVNVPKGPYGEAVKRNTRTAAVYRGVEAVLYAYATNLTIDFLQARADRAAEIYHIPPGEAEVRAGEVAARESGKHAFFLSVETIDRYSNDLDRPTSQWGITLKTPGGILQPDSIYRMRARPVEVQAFYPFFTNFFVAYLVSFPDTIGDGPYTLIIAGPRGQATMVFDGKKDRL